MFGSQAHVLRGDHHRIDENCGNITISTRCIEAACGEKHVEVEVSSPDLETRLAAAVQTGTPIALWAGLQPDKIAIVDPDGTTHSYAKINANANRLARLFRERGIGVGDSVALVCSNRAEFVEVLAGTLRCGVRLTPVNWHLSADEIAHIVLDCRAKALFAEARVPNIASVANQCSELDFQLAIGGAIEGYDAFHDVIALFDSSDIPDPVVGNRMLYTSGTTGRPKGVLRAASPVMPNVPPQSRHYDFRTSVQLCAGPAYHAAPLILDVLAAMGTGSTLIFMDRWDSEQVLRTISEQRVTHFHMVPIMFQRLLSLPEKVRAKYPVDHVRFIVHGAAPCPPEVKHAMIEWFGPILEEYYAGSEGGAGFYIDSHEWLKKPGSVGRRPELLGVRILDETGRDLPNGQIGTIYNQVPPGGGFSYFNDEVKTKAGRVDDYFTMGDIGYFDEDDYLFLTGRDAETIIAGGVNIYPQEIDNELIKHTAVGDSATVGVPHDEWGEEVKAVIMLKPGFEPSELLAEEILDFARKALASFKVPRSLEFVAELPRSEAGKVQRNKVRAPYWVGRSRQI